MKIKICGIRNVNEANKASLLGADYFGLIVEYPGTNLSLTREEAKEIIRKLPHLKFIILTILSNPDKVYDLILYTKPWGIQLLNPSKKIIKILKPLKTKTIAVIFVSNNEAMLKIKEYGEADYLLLDSKVGNKLGGTGITHDWNISNKIVKSSKLPVILAGGLNIENVGNAIKKVSPWGVDIESSMRNKNEFRDLSKIKKFIEKVKQNSYK